MLLYQVTKNKSWFIVAMELDLRRHLIYDSMGTWLHYVQRSSRIMSEMLSEINTMERFDFSDL